MYGTPIASNKKQKINHPQQQLSIVFAEHDPFTAVPECFNIAIELAKKILSSKIYAKKIEENVDDFDEVSFDNGLKSPYCIKMTSIKSCATAYCWVTRQDPENEKTVFFNPLLIMSLLLRQGNPIVFANQIIFITVKLVHEISHLLHWTSSNTLRTSSTKVSPSKDFNDIIKEVRKGGEQISYLKPVTYNDFGEIMEKELFGGLVELKSDDTDSFMDFVRIGFYESKESKVGNFVDSVATREKFDNAKNFAKSNFYLVHTTEGFVSTLSPEFSRVKIQGGKYRLSEGAEDVVVDQEIVEDDDDEEEERDVLIKR